MKAKIISIVLLLVCAFSLFTACSNDRTDSSPDKYNESAKKEVIIKETQAAELEGSQTEMNLSAEEELLLVNKEMDSILTAIYSEYSDNKIFKQNLKKSQDLWLKFHDAEMLARYPENDELREGSAFNLCWFSHKVELKKQRINNLKVWLEGIREGDVCSGSVKIKK